VRIYIAGPMTGLPDHNFPAFFAAARRLRAAGHGVCCPADNGAPQGGKPWSHYMRCDLLDLLTCDAVATLDGWQQSRGASLEVFLACQLDMTVLPVDALMERAA